MAHKKKSDYKKTMKNLSNNYWIVSTVVLSILLIITLIFGGIGGSSVSKSVVGQKVLTFANERGANATLVSVNDTGSLYEVIISIKGQQVPVYVTKDGENLIPSLVPLTAAATPSSQSPSSSSTSSKETPKTDKPKVELYVFSYCPYGSQAEKGILPVVKLLGDKIDFKIRQIGEMHGPFEKVEAERQLCIEKEYPTKLFDYVDSFVSDAKVGTCRGSADCVDPIIESIYTKLGIDKKKINSCMGTDGETLYTAEEQNAKKMGVSGSPTLFINGAKSSAGRNQASYLAGICSAFNVEPSECNETLSSVTPSPGFGGGETTSASSTGAQC